MRLLMTITVTFMLSGQVQRALQAQYIAQKGIVPPLLMQLTGGEDCIRANTLPELRWLTEGRHPANCTKK